MERGTSFKAFPILFCKIQIILCLLHELSNFYLRENAYNDLKPIFYSNQKLRFAYSSRK